MAKGSLKPKWFLEVQKKNAIRKAGLISIKSRSEAMSYHSGARVGHLTSKGYLEYVDQRLGFSKGTLYDLCLAAIKSKTKTKQGVTVTYRGETSREMRMSSHHFVQVRKAIFLIEFKETKAGKQVDRVLQVHVEV